MKQSAGASFIEHSHVWSKYIVQSDCANAVLKISSMKLALILNWYFHEWRRQEWKYFFSAIMR